MIGVAGCGRMGAPMLASMRKAGFTACGFDVRSDTEVPTEDLIEIPEAFAEKITTLISVVRDINQTNALLFDTQKFAKAPNLKRIIICSTLSPNYLHDIRHKIPAHISLVDAPMSGAQIAARNGKLSFMLGGDPKDLDEIQPMLDAMGTHFHRMGPYASGMQAKVLNNLLAASNTAMTRLVLEWADQTSLDQDKLLELIQTSSGQNWFASGFGNIEFSKDGISNDNSIGILVKDVQSALDSAPETANQALPMAVQSALSALKPRN